MSLRQKFSAVVALATVAVGNVIAAVPTEVTTAIGEAKTDALSVAGTMLGIAAALLAFVYIRRQMK